MPTPEINVRLTADGVQDVVNAFKRVQQESKNTSAEISLLGEAGAQLQDLIPLVTLGAVVEKTIEWGKEAFQSAISIGQLSEKTGASAGTLSVLLNVSEDLGVSSDATSSALVKLARSMEQASQGGKQQQSAFKALGISMTDIQTLDPGDMFVKIAQQIQKLPDGAQKAAISMQLFGRSGAQLIPVLNEIGSSGGFDEATQQAKALGLYLSDEMVADAQAAQRAFADIKDIQDGLARSFVAGFVPQMTAGMVAVANSFKEEGGDGIKAFGDEVGQVVRTAVSIFLGFGKIVGAVGAMIAVTLQSSFTNFGNIIDAFKKGGISGVISTYQNIWSDWSAQINAIDQQATSEIDTLFNTPVKTSTGPSKPKGTGASGDGVSDADKQKALREQQKLIDAQAAYRESVSNAELARLKTNDQQEEEQDKALYASGLITLQEYYDARAAIINREADAESKILEEKLQTELNAAAQLTGKSADQLKDLVAQGPEAVIDAVGNNPQALKMLQSVSATMAQIDASEAKRQQDLAQNTAQAQQAQHQANQQLIADRQRLYELEGDTTSAQQAALDRELAETNDLLVKLGVAESERQAILTRARVNATSRTQVANLQQQGGNEFSDLNNQTQAIQDRASAGMISQLDAEVQIYNLEKDRLPVLQAIAAQMENAVDEAEVQLLWLKPGTDEYNAQLLVVNNLARQAAQYSAQVDHLSMSLKQTSSLAVQLSNQLMNQGGTAVVSFFDAIETGSKSGSDAFADLGKSFEQMIVHMIDQMLVYYALMALLGWIPGGTSTSLYKSLQNSGPFSGLTGHAGGGYTGNAPTNQVTGFVHGKEFVFNAGATAAWGVPMLQAMSDGRISSIASPAMMPMMSAAELGGDSAGAGPLLQVNIDTGGNAAKQSKRTGSGGQSILDVVIQGVATDIQSGGKVGQSIQSSYGVSRRGQVRG